MVHFFVLFLNDPASLHQYKLHHNVLVSHEVLLILKIMHMASAIVKFHCIPSAVGCITMAVCLLAIFTFLIFRRPVPTSLYKALWAVLQTEGCKVNPKNLYSKARSSGVLLLIWTSVRTSRNLYMYSVCV